MNTGSAMKRDDLDKLDIAEDDQHTKLEQMIVPADVRPKGIREYPAKLEQCEKMRRICRNRVVLLKEQMQNVEDVHLTQIEEEEITVTKPTNGYLPQKIKKYRSEIKRQRELRIRLANDEKFQTLKKRKEQYDEARSRWVDHIARLRRELRQLEVDYSSNGGMGVGL